MAGFIENFYYGNIEPQERSERISKAAQKQFEVLVDNEEALTKALTDESKQQFLEYVNAWHEVNCDSNLDSFIMGFRLGARFAYDAFVDADAPVKT